MSRQSAVVSRQQRQEEQAFSGCRLRTAGGRLMIKRRNLPPWLGRFPGVSWPKLEPRSEAKRWLFEFLTETGRASHWSHALSGRALPLLLRGLLGRLLRGFLSGFLCHKRKSPPFSCRRI